MSDEQKVVDILWAAKRFWEIPCANVEIGALSSPIDCPGCASDFLEVVRGIMSGKKPLNAEKEKVSNQSNS